MKFHDRIHKDLLHRMFPDFLEAFFPHIVAEVDLNSVAFLEQEFGDLEDGSQRAVDVLARLAPRQSAKGGKPRYILIHVENQDRSDPDFPRRMFVYFVKIWLNHPDAIIYPVVIYTHNSAKPESTEFEITTFDLTCLRFEFRAIHLRREDWRTWTKTPNPAVAALLAKMGDKNTDRVERRLAAIKQLNELVASGVSPRKLHFILAYHDAYLELDEEEALQLEEGMRKLGINEESEAMEYLTNAEKEAIKRGKEKGLQEGRKEGREEGRQEGLEEGRLEVLTFLHNGILENEIQLTAAQNERLSAYPFEKVVTALAALHANPAELADWIDQHP